MIALSAMLRRHRRRVALAVVVAALAGSVALAHGAAAERHMAIGAAVAACVAIVAEAGLALAGAACRSRRVRWMRLLVSPAANATGPRVSAWRVTARAGPAELQVFRR